MFSIVVFIMRSTASRLLKPMCGVMMTRSCLARASRTQGWASLCRPLAKITIAPGNDDDIAVWVFQPNLSVPRVRIDLWRFEHLGAQRVDPRYRLIEFVSLEPEHRTIAIGLCMLIALVWMFMGVPVMQLQNYSALADHLFVLRPPMPALAPKHGLVPDAAGLNIPNSYERLCLHLLPHARVAVPAL